MSKLGFIVDLIRGIKKILTNGAPENAPSNSGNGVTQTVTPLLKRGTIFLEDKNWAAASEYADKVLDVDPENSEAYLIRTLAALKRRKAADLESTSEDLSENTDFQNALRFANGVEKNLLESVYKNAEAFRNKRLMEEADYLAKSNEINQLSQALKLYQSLPESEERNERIASCKKSMEAAEAKLVKARKKKKRLKIAGIAATVVVVLGLSAYFAYIKILVPKQEYEAALRLQQNGEYDDAFAAFNAIGAYKDSAEQAQYSLYLKAQEYLNAEQYDEAIEQFSALGDFKDCADMVKEATLRKATKMFESKKDRESAIQLLETLGDYGDADQLALSWRYDYASASSYERAYKYFSSIPGYKDADERLVAALDSWINSCFNNSTTQRAKDLMSVVPHDEKLYDAIYRIAKEKLNSLLEREESETDEGLRSIYYSVGIVESEAFKYFMNQLPATYDYTKEMAAFVVELQAGKTENWKAAGKRLFSDRKTVKTLYENFPIIRDYFETGGFSFLFYYGNWTTSDGAYHLLWKDSDNDNQSTWSEYNLPRPVDYGNVAYWGLYDHTMVWLDKDNKLVSKLYDFEFVDYDTMRVHCYQNDRTYTLTR